MSDDWVSKANPADLDALASALESGRVSPQRDEVAAVQALGVTDVAGVRAMLAATASLDARGVAWGLRRIAAERRAASDRLARSAQLVWSGPVEDHHALRDTRAVLDEVCAKAERHVVLATYVVYDGLRTLKALARRMRDLPSLRVDFYVDLKADDHSDEDRAAAAWMRRFRAQHWPSDVHLPTVWYDPAGLDRHAGISLHAKCVVVDERWTFVTSANFTEAAQARNIEVGVLLDHPAMAQNLCAQFQSLRDHARLRRMPDP